MEISSKFVANSAVDLGTKNAWARIVRRRWPNNGVKGAMAEWGLTEAQAKGVVYAQASQSTIDKILRASGPIRGFALGLEVLSTILGIELEDYIEQTAREAANEKAKWEAEERRLAVLSSRLPERRSFLRDKT